MNAPALFNFERLNYSRGFKFFQGKVCKLEATDSARELIRVGIVTSTDPIKNTCRVTFEDKNNLVSSDLRILHRGSSAVKDYWMPAVGDEAVCIFATNDENYCDGFIVGTLFNDKDKNNAH